MDVSDEELVECLRLHNFKLIEPIGKGKYGRVFLVRNIKYNQEMVLKVSELRESTENLNPEIDQLKKLSHPNIILLYDYWTSNNILYIIMKYCVGGSMEQKINSDGLVPLPQLRTWLRQILSAIALCHSNGIAHNDIKPANILIDEYGRAQLADFGLSKNVQYGTMMKGMVGTPVTMPPEMIKNMSYNPFKSDIWSLGITVYWMATGSIPWDCLSLQDLQKVIGEACIIYPKFMDPDLSNMLRAMLDANPDKRKTARELLDMPFLNKDPEPKSDRVFTGRRTLSLAGKSIFAQSHKDITMGPGRSVPGGILPRHLTGRPIRRLSGVEVGLHGPF